MATLKSRHTLETAERAAQMLIKMMETYRPNPWPRARSVRIGVRVGYPDGNRHVAEIWPARLAGNNDAGSPRKSPARQERKPAR